MKSPKVITKLLSRQSMGYISVLPIILAALFLLPQSVQSNNQQINRQLANDNWRAMTFPQNEWAVGFSQLSVTPSVNLTTATQRATESARSELAKNISMRIETASRSEVFSSLTQGREFLAREYGQVINTFTTAEVSRVEIRHHHDQATNIVYVLAAVKWSQLADYYASIIESNLSDAESALGLAAQSAQYGKVKEHADRLAEAKKKVDAVPLYRHLLIAVDPQGGLKRAQNDRADKILKQINSASVAGESLMMVFVTGKETILGEDVEIIIPAVTAILNENNIRITENREEAGYILTITARTHNASSDSRYSYSESNVRVVLRNTKTNKDEVTTSFTGPREGQFDARTAAEAAFKAAVPEVWKRLQGKIKTK